MAGAKETGRLDFAIRVAARPPQRQERQTRRERLQQRRQEWRLARRTSLRQYRHSTLDVRAFGKLIKGANGKEIRRILDIGSISSSAEFYDIATKTCMGAQGCNDVPWPILQLIQGFNRKHIFLSSRFPACPFLTRMYSTILLVLFF